MGFKKLSRHYLNGGTRYVNSKLQQTINKLREFSKKLELSYLLIFQLIFTLFALFQSWIFQYRNEEGNPNLIGRISFRVVDTPFMLSPETLTPILYKHYFGDWQNLLDVANQSNPYLLPNGPSQTPPLGNIFLKLLSTAGPRYSYMIFLGITLIIWIWLFRKATKSHPVLYTLLAVTLYFILTLPAIYSFDRGSLHIFAVGLIGVAWGMYLEKRHLISVAYFILAVSIKPQLSILLLLLLFRLDFRKIARAIIATISVNFILILIFFAQPFRSAVGFLNGTLFFTNANSGGYILDSASLMGFLSRRIEGRYGTEHALNWMTEHSEYLLVPSAILVLIIVPIMFFKPINQRVKIFLVLSLLSLVIPASMHYTLTWASLAVIPFLTNKFNFEMKDSEKRIDNEEKSFKKQSKLVIPYTSKLHVSDYLSLLTITLLLSPSFAVYWTGARDTSIIRDLYPFMVFVTIFIVYLENFVIKATKKTTLSKRNRVLQKTK